MQVSNKQGTCIFNVRLGHIFNLGERMNWGIIVIIALVVARVIYRIRKQKDTRFKRHKYIKK